MLFESIVFGAFVGSLVDYWLGRFTVRDNIRLVVAVGTGVVVGVLVYLRHVAYF